MDPANPLRGGCSCGRNQYLIYTSPSATQHLQVLFDNLGSSGKRRCLNLLLNLSADFIVREGHTLSLRVPLPLLHSMTRAYYEDEMPHSIRRVFTPYDAPHTKRHFCGFCGTQLSHWSEESREEAEWICVNFGSLRNESVERLEEAGLLATPAEDEEDPESNSRAHESANLDSAMTRPDGRESRGVPWFEEMVQGSEMGRIKRRRGGETSADGRSKVEWEVVEIGGDDGDGVVSSTAKRKISHIVREEEGDDIHMRE
ncbi:MAG: hypothetical protein Q9191_002906 [Dirinaria sp. TL-2023a]